MISTNLAAQSEETALINKAVQGDLEAFNRLVLNYQDMAYNHARAQLSDPASAEDAVQDSFIKAFQNLHGFRCGSFRG
jgi:RNA polymerase sigma-70 factor, ECF subfamily